jgi:hypothetical protein
MQCKKAKQLILNYVFVSGVTALMAKHAEPSLATTHLTPKFQLLSVAANQEIWWLTTSSITTTYI